MLEGSLQRQIRIAVFIGVNACRAGHDPEGPDAGNFYLDKLAGHFGMDTQLHKPLQNILHIVPGWDVKKVLATADRVELAADHDATYSPEVSDYRQDIESQMEGMSYVLKQSFARETRAMCFI